MVVAWYLVGGLVMGCLSLPAVKGVLEGELRRKYYFHVNSYPSDIFAHCKILLVHIKAWCI